MSFCKMAIFIHFSFAFYTSPSDMDPWITLLNVPSNTRNSDVNQVHYNIHEIDQCLLNIIFL